MHQTINIAVLFVSFHTSVAHTQPTVVSKPKVVSTTISAPAPVVAPPPVVTRQDNPNHCTPDQYISADSPFTCINKPVTPVPVTTPPYSGSLSDWLLKLRTCESGGDYSINTGNGYYGAYQFTISTWDSLNTGYSRADLAPAGAQDQAIIANTNRSSGGLATQNPGCYQKEGLSAFPPN